MVQNIKKYKNYYKVLRKEETFKIEPFVFVKYNIKEGLIISDDKWNEILKENHLHYYDRIASVYLKKIRSEHEVYNYLKQKGANEDVTNNLLIKYNKLNFINDKNYIIEYINLYKMKQGPILIKEKLLKKGIDSTLIEYELSSFDEDKAVSLLIKNILKNTKNKTKLEIQNTIKRRLLTRGFSEQIIDNHLLENIEKIDIDEIKLLESRYNLRYMRKDTYKNHKDFILKTRNILLRQGFKEEDIIKIEGYYNKDS